MIRPLSETPVPPSARSAARRVLSSRPRRPVSTCPPASCSTWTSSSRGSTKCAPVRPGRRSSTVGKTTPGAPAMPSRPPVALALTDQQRAELHDAVGTFNAERCFAVRSSPPEEDLAGTSFTGGYERPLRRTSTSTWSCSARGSRTRCRCSGASCSAIHARQGSGAPEGHRARRCCSDSRPCPRCSRACSRRTRPFTTTRPCSTPTSRPAVRAGRSLR